MKRLLMVALGLVLLAGCGSGGGSSGDGVKGATITTHLVDSSATPPSSAARLSASSSPSSPPDAILIRSPSFEAFSYRPGEAVQAGSCNLGNFPLSMLHKNGNGACTPEGLNQDNLSTACVTPDWSSWVLVQRGDGRPALLQRGGSLEIPRSVEPITKAYLDQVGHFRADMFSFEAYDPGIVSGGTFYGTTTSSDWAGISSFPEYADIPQTLALATFPDASQPWVNFLFVRSDWFPDPVHVQLSQSGEVVNDEGCGTPTFAVAWSSAPLDEQQQQLLLSLADQHRLFIENTYVIPFKGPVDIDMSGASSAALRGNIDLTLGLDLDFIIKTTLGGPELDGTPTLAFQADENGLPFGLTLSLAVDGTPALSTP